MVERAGVRRITRIEVSLHQLGLEPPFPAAWDRRPRAAFPVTVYRVFDDEGRMGFGAGDAMRGMVDYLHLFVGEDPLDLPRHSAVLDNICFFDGRPWPLEIALWDLAGKIEGEPIWRLVGGRAGRIRPYASSGTHWPLGEVEERIEQVIASGFGALKLRLGRPRLDEDLAVLHRATGGGVPVRADGRLQPGLADAVGHPPGLDLRPRPGSGSPAGGGGGAVDGGAAPPGGLRGDGPPPSGDERSRRRG
jgi:L-alanine-DL-glutamate epimerase-like enolase superfamily enzyme